MRTLPALELALGALLLLAPQAASAQTPPAVAATAAKSAEARAHFKRGVELYSESDYNNALIEFRRAYEIEPRFQALYDIGETYFQLQDYANALQTLERYLRDGGSQVPEARRIEVGREIEKLRTRVATVEVTTNLPDTSISVDDVPIGKTPMAPIVVSAGRRRITASKGTAPPVTQVVELAGGDTRRLSLTLAEEPPVAPLAPRNPMGPVAVAPAPPPKTAHVPVAPWVITGVLGAAGIVTGSLALVSAGQTRSDLQVYPNASSSTISSDHTYAGENARAAILAWLNARHPRT